MSAIAGGTVGVMGTLIGLELKQKNVENRSVCPYCTGAGTLVCGRCYGSGKLTVKLDLNLNSAINCSCCSGKGSVTCNICRGDGASVPAVMEYKYSDPNVVARLGKVPIITETFEKTEESESE
eukprot:CAMPEP_0171453938 /NCGR_PEP_ID=MMETSP0945-20130129/1433_1 /TAXON_ID=109269 /ORGANISM="Vaucheria litorea, Strain CCMP2940" /LENGTH=122 /DNA_ID=CAMNT_0011978879 /DNA_START=201 /DNA_END=566 /DNA_ORIENTATION=-